MLEIELHGCLVTEAAELIAPGVPVGHAGDGEEAPQHLLLDTVRLRASRTRARSWSRSQTSSRRAPARAAALRPRASLARRVWRGWVVVVGSGWWWWWRGRRGGPWKARRRAAG
jgi:hypothetical protein